MRLLMAVSADGFLARGPDDDMRWTGRLDKKVFRLLTGVGGVCGAGSTTYDLMETTLKGRTLFRLSRSGHDMGLRLFAEAHPSAWLIGGPTIAVEAFQRGLIDEVHLYRSEVKLDMPKPQLLSDPHRNYFMDVLFPYISGPLFPLVSEVTMEDGHERIRVQTYRRPA